MARIFGRHYIIRWDGEAKGHRVTLGKDAIGFHETQEGARAVAVSHAYHLTMPNMPPFDVRVQASD